jgi:hypothetical protein
MKQIRYTKSAIKALRRMSVNTAKLIAVKPLFHRNYCGKAGRSVMGMPKVGDGT